MPEQRDTRTTVNMEATYRAMIERIITERGITASEYMRELVIRDLVKRGIITEDVLLRVSLSTTQQDLEALVVKAAS